MINFVICDDNKNILNRLGIILESIFIKNNLSGQIVYSTTNPDNFLDYIKNHHFDIVILDIDLKANLSGIDLANIIRKRNKKAYIVFTTAHLEYMMVAYKYKTFDFLAKPITAERLEETIIRLFEDISDNENSFFKFGNKKEYINTNDIFFIQKQGKKAIFKTPKNDLEINASFNEILSHLPSNFVRCHKSYIVNTNKISYINSDNTITFSGNFKDQCFIGPKYEHIL